MTNKIQKQNIGNAGEYYIASRLSAENFVTTITLGRAERYDILAVNPKGRTLKFSVKTRILKKVQRFPLAKKDERGGSSDFYYVFIRLNEFKEDPDFWIIPSKRINKLLLSKSYRGYFKKHKDIGIRNFWLKLNSTSKAIGYTKNWENELTKKYYRNLTQLA